MRQTRKIRWIAISLGLLLISAGCRELTDPTEGAAPSVTTLSTTQTTRQTTLEQTEATTQPSSSQPIQPSSEETKPSSHPVTEPPTEQPTLPQTEPTAEPTTLPQTEPPTEMTTLPQTEPTTQPTTAPTQPIPDEPAIPQKMTVEASGLLVKESGDAIIDYSNTTDGYVMACYRGASEKRLKVQVKGPTTTYTYNLTPGKWAAFPLSDENGVYKITIYRNTTGSKYAAVVSQSFTAQMADEFAPFLRSNQYVDFDAAPETVAMAAALTKGIDDPLKKVEKVYDFVVGGMTYDKELAATVKSGYLPVLDDVLKKMKGICFDYAALMTGMLRSQGVPTKLVVGYAGEVYHAWISVWSETTGWVDGVIFFDGEGWQRMDPTFASGGNNSDILDYIGDGSNYTAKYFY